MDRSNIPVESMRCAGLPVGWQDPDWPHITGLYDDDGSPRVVGLGGSYYLTPRGSARPRRCRCGEQVMTGSRADKAHIVTCGPLDEQSA